MLAGILKVLYPLLSAYHTFIVDKNIGNGIVLTIPQVFYEDDKRRPIIFTGRHGLIKNRLIKIFFLLAGKILGHGSK